MRLFIAKNDLKVTTANGEHTVMKGMLFVVEQVEDLPHPIGENPAFDSNQFSETDRWAKSGAWKKAYDEYECTFKKV